MEYVQSGFDTLDEWIEKIEHIYGKTRYNLQLYKVMLEKKSKKGGCKYG